MSKCGSCNHVNEPGSAFCLNCGAKLDDAAPAAAPQAPAVRASTVGGLERGVYFKIARVVAWVLLVIALGGMAYAAVKLFPALADMNASAAEVTAKEVRASVESARSRTSAQPGQENPFGSGSASERASLDEAIYKLADVLPPDAVNQFGNMEGFRSFVKQSLQGMGPADIDDQKDVLEDAADIVKELPAEDRVNGISAYFNLVAQHAGEAEARKTEGQAKAALYAGVFASSGITLMMITMTLVLLAIERNTRGQAE